jgi:hypothetical protein
MKRSLMLNLLIAAGLLAGIGLDARGETIQDIIDGGGSLAVGDVVFSDFSVTATAENAIPIEANLINVTGVVEGGGVAVRIDMSGAWSADTGLTGAAYALSSTHLRFKVTALADAVIDGVELEATNWSTTGTASIQIYENIYDQDPSGPTSLTEIGALSVYKNRASEDYYDADLFATSQSVVWVDKTVSLSAMDFTEGNDMASLGMFYQRFNTNDVPEPATLALLGCGAIGLLRRRRRKT